jgi:hypothetical protein
VFLPYRQPMSPCPVQRAAASEEQAEALEQE